MRKLAFLIVIAVLLFTMPAFAVDDFYGPEDGSKVQDSRRPDLGIGGQERAGSPEQAAPEFVPGESSWEEFYSQTIDWNMFMDRLYEILTDDKMQEAHPEVALIASMYKDMGILDLGVTDVKYAVTGDSIYLRSRADYDPAPETIMGRALAIENQPLLAAEFIAPDDYMLYIGVTNMVDRLLLELDALAEVSGTLDEMGEDNPFNSIAGEMGMEDFSQVMAMLDAMRIKDMVSSTLSGELGIVLYGLPPFEQLAEGDIEPGDIDAALFVGLNDVDYAKNLVASFGSEIGLKPVEQPHDDFTYYLMDGEDTVGLILGQGMGIITPNMPGLIEHLHRDNLGLGLEPAQFYLDVNMAKLHEFALPLVEMAKEEMGGVYLPEEEAAYLFNLPEPEALGHVSMLAKTDENSSFFAMEMKKALVQYLMYYVGVFGCGAAQMEMGMTPGGCSGDCGDCPSFGECGGDPNECLGGEGDNCDGM